MTENTKRYRQQRVMALFAIVGVFVFSAVTAVGQGLRFDNRREVTVPEYATVRIGPFYSTMRFTAAAGYRYTTSDGRGTDYVFSTERGRIRQDGGDIPITLGMDFRNYLVLTRFMDVDISVSTRYRYYPLDTQENLFSVGFPQEGISGSLSTEIIWTEYLRSTVYDKLRWQTDYIDAKGQIDDTAGRLFEYISNTFGVNTDWLMSADKNLGLDLSRRDFQALDDEFEEQDRVEYRESLVYEQQVRSGLVIGGRVTAVQRDYDVETREDTSQLDYGVFARMSGSESGDIPITDASTLSVSLGGSIGATSGGRGNTGLAGTATDDGRRVSNPDVTSVSAAAELRTQIMKDVFQSITYSRGLRGSFNSPFEEYDRWRYELDFTRAGPGITVFSQYDAAEPTLQLDENYSTWTSGFTLNVPVTRFITLDGLASYAVRSNGARRLDDALTDDDVFAAREIAADNSDYETLTLRLGTTFPLIRFDENDMIDLETSIERVERYSDNEDQDFTRDTFYAGMRYSHQF